VLGLKEASRSLSIATATSVLAKFGGMHVKAGEVVADVVEDVEVVEAVEVVEVVEGVEAVEAVEAVEGVEAVVVDALLFVLVSPPEDLLFVDSANNSRKRMGGGPTPFVTQACAQKNWSPTKGTTMVGLPARRPAATVPAPP
jgi:hypothetical protein